MSQRLRPYFLMVCILLFMAAFLVWPLAHAFQKAFIDNRGFTLFYIHALLTDPLQIEAIGNSFLIAALVTIGCIIIALPLAWLIARRSFFGKTFISGFILLPLILPPFVGAVGMKLIFSRSGPLSTLFMNLGMASGPIDWLGTFPLFGIVIMEVLHLFPVLYLNLVAAFSNVDPSLEECASNLGASPASVFRRVTLPLAMPGMFAGTILVFIWSFTELGTPLVFGWRRVLPVMIYDSVSEIGTNPMGYAQVVFVLAVSVAGFWISKRMMKGKANVATLGRLSVSGKEKPLPFLGAVAAYILIGAVLIIALLPHLSIILIASSRRWFLSILPEGFTLEFFNRAIGSDLTQTALLNSLLLATSASVIDIIIGFCIAWLCVRSRVRGSDLLDSLAMASIAIPGLVIAFGYMGCFSRAFAKTLLDPRTNPMLLLAIGYAIRRLPYMVRAAHAGLQQTSCAYEESAANLGASPIRVIRRVTLPLISANLLAGGILCFAFSMLEVSDSMILAQSEQYYPITKAIYALLDSLENGMNVASALGVWAMALLAAAVLWVSCIMGKRMGQMFRAG